MISQYTKLNQDGFFRNTLKIRDGSGFMGMELEISSRKIKIGSDYEVQD